MSTTTTRPVAADTDRDALAREAERRAVRRAAGVTIRVVRTIGGWYWAIFLIVAVAIVLGQARFGSGMGEGVIDAQMGGPSRWFVLVLGIIIPAAYLRLHVAAGGTRRTLATGTVRGAIGGGAMLGLVTALYLVGERALFGALGQTWSREFGLPVDGYAGIALTIVTEALVVATYYLVGAAISAGYYRLGLVLGTAYVVVALVPAALVDLATHTGVVALLVGPQNLPDGGPGVLLGLAGGAATVALAGWLFGKPLRSVPLRPAASREMTMTTPTVRPASKETAMGRIDMARAQHLRGVAGVSRRLRRAGTTVGIWFWVIYVLYAVGITVGNAATGSDLEISAFDATIGSSRWPMIWLGMSASVGVVAVHVAAGGSRRSLFEGVLRGSLVVGAGFGVVTTLVLLGERALSTSLDMTWRRLGALPFDSPGTVLGTAVAESLVITTYLLFGACIGAGFAHFRAWGALLVVPLAVPAVLVDLATRTGVVGSIANIELRPDLDHAEVPPSEGLTTMLLGLGGATLAVVLAALVLYALLRTIPVRPA